MTAIERRALFAAWAMKISYIAFLLSLTLGTWVWVQEGRQPSISIWLIRTVPILLFAYGVFKHRLRSIAWLCFAVLMYFAMAVTEAMSPYVIWFNYIELAVVVVLFCSATAFIRWQAQMLKAKQAEGTASE
ncbi:DUF2069 domain-containing protein [Zhongshania sp.]|uniref:DUF2069 domain-containing protein n=1 Tax=Zhongshania sp. TaxID=1971902 RepID=UPI003561F286